MPSRRAFLGRISAMGLGLAGAPALAPWLRPRWLADPFTLGVASGDPGPDGVVLWTRLAPDPLAGGGMPDANVEVRWELALDDRMRRVVKRGSAVASPELAHSVHVELDGLEPGRWYWYRFSAGGAESPIGRTRTMPAASETPDRLRFAFASCQHYEYGYYAALRHLAAEDIAFVVHLGDYIYETAPRPGLVRLHANDEPRTLEEYRNRYAQYKSDADLQAAHAAFPWIVTWDDHEVSNNYVSAFAADSTPAARFLERRAAAYRAFYEHQPLRRSAMPRGPDALMYRTLSFGSLARFHVLDTRQYRSDQVCGDGRRPTCAEWPDPARTALGQTQERWLHGGLAASTSRWNVLAQQIAFAPIDNDPGPAENFAMDSWGGYPAARERLLGHVATLKDPNVVVISGDIHASFASSVPRNFREPGSRAVASEFIGTSISSGGNGSPAWPGAPRMMANNPWIKYHRNLRGYVRCEVTPGVWRSDYRVLPRIDSPDVPIATDASFVTAAGAPGVERA